MGGRGAKSGGSPGSPGQARPASEPQKPTSEPPRERPRKLPVETPPPVKEKKERKRREREKTVSLEEFLEANDKKYLKNNPHVWYYDELKTLRHEQKPYATIDAATGEIRVKDLYQYRGPIKRLGFEFDTSGWWYKPIGETPAKNREIVTALRNIGIPVKMTERTVLETQYNRTLAQEIYSRSPEKAQEIIDKNAKKTLRRYGLI